MRSREHGRALMPLRRKRVVPDFKAPRQNARDFAEMCSDATGAAANLWLAGEVIRRMVAALDAADAMLAESLTGDVRATTASEYAKARERIAI